MQKDYWIWFSQFQEGERMCTELFGKIVDHIGDLAILECHDIKDGEYVCTTLKQLRDNETTLYRSFEECKADYEFMFGNEARPWEEEQGRRDKFIDWLIESLSKATTAAACRTLDDRFASPSPVKPEAWPP